MNFLVFGSAFACQYLIGAIIDLWPLTPEGGYDARGYQVGFAVFLAIQVASLMWYLAKPIRTGEQKS